MSDPARKLLTRRDVAARVGVSLRTAERWVLPDLPAIRIGSVLRFAAEDVDAWLDAFRTMDREWFRGRKRLIPLVEDTFDVLTGASLHPDRVLLLSSP